jgi:hypothetical protein
MESESSSCTWKIVVGHQPGKVHGSGLRRGSEEVDHLIQPILDEFEAEIYLCGDHLNSQHVTNLPYKTHVFVAGHIMDSHAFHKEESKGQLIWGTDTEPAILELNITAEEIKFALHSGFRGKDDPPVRAGSISHKGSTP